MELIQLKISDKDNSIKYVLKLSGKEIGYAYIFSRENNPIEIYIDEDYQSNGYGKILFNSLLKILKSKGLKGCVFEIDESNYRFINILTNAGAMKVGSHLSMIKFIIKL
ncbi:MAG: GNAT family N-acetyltransferase [Clostridia bacterium]|nr:GNAT family N-acetyltransferase [Clostridia bacterium]